MHRVYRIAALGALLLCVGRVSAQSSDTFTFEDNTDDGFGLKFSNDASANFQIIADGAPGNGTNYMRVPRSGGFQEADRGSGDATFVAAMQAAMANPAGYDISYDYYIPTAAFGTGQGNFLQVGTYVNEGDGTYAQDFGAIKEVELNGTQLASGTTFAGHVDVNIAAAGLTIHSNDTFYRLGVILNGDGAGQFVDFDNISVHPVPEPASLSLLGLGVSALAMRRRRSV